MQPILVSGLSNGTPTLLFVCRASRILACVKATVHTIFEQVKSLAYCQASQQHCLPYYLVHVACLLWWLFCKCQRSWEPSSQTRAHGVCFSIRLSAWATRSVFSHTGVMIAVYCETTSLRAGWLLWLNTCPAWDWCVVSKTNTFFFCLFFGLQNTDLQYFPSLEGEWFIYVLSL